MIPALRCGPSRHRLRYLQLKRQHSAEPVNSNGAAETRKTSKSNTPSAASTPKVGISELAATPLMLSAATADVEVKISSTEGGIVGSPMKKQRASLPGFNDETLQRRLGAGLTSPGAIGEMLGTTSNAQATESPVEMTHPSGDAPLGAAPAIKKEDADEEL